MKKILLYSGIGVLIFVVGFLSGSVWMSNRFITNFSVSSADRDDFIPSPSSDSFFVYQYFGGTPEHESTLKPIPDGDGYLQVKFVHNKKAATGVRCKVVLDSKFATGWVESDQSGIITIKTPSGKLKINSVQCNSWRNKPEGEFLIVMPGERTLGDGGIGDRFPGFFNKGKELEVYAKKPEQPQLTLLLKRRIEIVWPERQNSKQAANIGKSKIDWKPYPEAKDYIVRIDKVSRKNRTTYYSPILYHKVSGNHEMPLSKLAHSRDPAAKEEYAVVVEAYGPNGEFLSESEHFVGTFTLTDGNVLVEQMGRAFDSSGEGQDAIDSLYQNTKLLQTAETLIQQKMFAQAEAIINKVSAAQLEGRKSLLTGYLYAAKGDCKKARAAFDNAAKKGEDCVPDEYKGNCR